MFYLALKQTSCAARSRRSSVTREPSPRLRRLDAESRAERSGTAVGPRRRQPLKGHLERVVKETKTSILDRSPRDGPADTALQVSRPRPQLGRPPVLSPPPTHGFAPRADGTHRQPPHPLCLGHRDGSRFLESLGISGLIQ